MTDLDPDSIAHEARLLAGATGQPAQFEDGLRQLVASLDGQARLTDDGRAGTRRALVTAFATQFQVNRLTARFPEIEGISVRPLFITGLLRTGTTFLQQLLAQHPDLRSPLLWELMNPASTERPERLVAGCQAYIDGYYRAAPEFRAIHELDACLPEECHRLTGNGFRHMIYGLRYRVGDYMEWLDRQSMVPAYRFHRAQLRCLLWRRPGPGGPVVLKCPSHLWHLDALGTVYPNAKVVRLHRSPAVAVPSVCSLTAAVRSARSADVDRAEIGDYWLGRVARALDGIRAGTAALPTPPLDIRYADLVANPIGTAARVCDYAGVRLTAEAAGRMRRFVAAKGRQPGGHRYRPEDFGLTARRLDRRFTDYINEFALAPRAGGI